MSITPEQITQAVIKSIPGFFNDAVDQFRDGEAIYIRDGQPEGIVAQVGQAVARSACRRYGAAGPGAVGSRGERFERACRPYLDSIDPGNGAGFATPYTGGQCAQSYRVISSRTVGEGAPVNSPSRALIGPLGATRVVEVGNSFTFEMFAQGSRSISGTTCGVVTSTTPGYFQLNSVVTTFRPVKFSVVSVTPCTGSVDNCGDPPPQVTQPDPQPDPQPPPFRFNPGPDIDIPIDVDLNPDGSIDINIGTGPVTIDPFADGDGGDGGGGDGGPGDPTDPGSPGDPTDTGSGGNDEGAAEEGEELVGLLVEVLQAPDGANVFSNNSDQPFRGIGYVRMGYPDRLGADISAGTVISPQFFHAQQRGLTNWAVSANTGFNLRTTPYYRSLEINV